MNKVYYGYSNSGYVAKCIHDWGKTSKYTLPLISTYTRVDQYTAYLPTDKDWDLYPYARIYE